MRNMSYPEGGLLDVRKMVTGASRRQMARIVYLSISMAYLSIIGHLYLIFS